MWPSESPPTALPRIAPMKLLLSCSLAVAVGVAAFIPVLVRSADRPENPTIHFNRDIRPILSNHCFKCHGPDQKKGGLDLQNADAARKTLKSGNVRSEERRV